MKENSSIFPYILVAISILCAAAGQIAMKSGLRQVGEITTVAQLFKFSTVTNIATTPLIIVGILLYVISLFLWLGALSSLNVSSMYPLVSLGYIVTAVAAFYFLKENITVVHWAGIFLIISGCIVLAKASG